MLHRMDPTSEPEAIGGSWTMGVAVNDGGAPSIFRVNAGLKDLGQSSPFDTAVQVTMTFTEVDTGDCRRQRCPPS